MVADIFTQPPLPHLKKLRTALICYHKNNVPYIVIYRYYLYVQEYEQIWFHIPF